MHQVLAPHGPLTVSVVSPIVWSSRRAVLAPSFSLNLRAILVQNKVLLAEIEAGRQREAAALQANADERRACEVAEATSVRWFISWLIFAMTSRGKSPTSRMKCRNCAHNWCLVLTRHLLCHKPPPPVPCSTCSPSPTHTFFRVEGTVLFFAATVGDPPQSPRLASSVLSNTLHEPSVQRAQV